MDSSDVRLLDGAIFGAGWQDVDDSHVNVLRAARVSTMHSHTVRLRLQHPHGLFVQGNQSIERVVAGQSHGQLAVDIDLSDFIVVNQEMRRDEVRVGQVE